MDNSSENLKNFNSSNAFKNLNSNIIVILGAQFGDEGKGKLVDMMATDADMCVRFNGGSNAGHTIVLDGVKYALHLLPCGCLYPNTINLLGNGVVIHLKTLINEMNSLLNVNPNIFKQLFISTRAHLLFDIYQQIDAEQEAAKKKHGNSIGTTKKGIGPCYTAKASRMGIRIGEMKNWTMFKQQYLHLHKELKQLYNIEINTEEELSRLQTYYELIKNQLVDTVPMMNSMMRKNKNILFEGANATMLDIDFGTYPYVTSSTTVVGGASVGLGVPPHTLFCVVGVIKAYTTRVGEGPFLTELNGNEGKHLLEKGHEFGTTTGRPRRCGWLDIPMLRYAKAINHFTAINLTKLDVLSGLKKVNVCVNYKNKHTGEIYEDGYYPACLNEFDDIECVYQTFDGWDFDIQNITSHTQFPTQINIFISTLQELIGIPIYWVGVGPDRSNTVSMFN